MKPIANLFLVVFLFAVSAGSAQDAATPPSDRQDRPVRERADRPPVPGLRSSDRPSDAPAAERQAIPPVNRWAPDLERERRAVMERVERLEQAVKERIGQLEGAVRERDEHIGKAAREFQARIEKLEAVVKDRRPQDQAGPRQPTDGQDQQRALQQAEQQMHRSKQMNAELEQRSRDLQMQAEKLERRAAEIEVAKRQLDERARELGQAKEQLDRRTRELEAREQRSRQADPNERRNAKEGEKKKDIGEERKEGPGRD